LGIVHHNQLKKVQKTDQFNSEKYDFMMNFGGRIGFLVLPHFA